MKKRLVVLSLLTFFVLVLGGCNANLQNVFKQVEVKNEEPLIKVSITFTNGESITGYIKYLGIEQESGRVYIGGSSVNYLYDKDGNVAGYYNYQRVLYIVVIPDNSTDEEKVDEQE